MSRREVVTDAFSISSHLLCRVLELVHGDLCGPVMLATPSGGHYFLLLVDDHSRFMWLHLLPSKDRAPEAIKRYQAAAEAKSGCKLHAFLTDQGEWSSGEVQPDFDEAWSMLKAKGLPRYFWGEVLMTAAYLLNRFPAKSLNGVTPFEAWHGKKPAVRHQRTFGCVAHFKVTSLNLKKLDDRSKLMIFIGYQPGSKAYRVYHHKVCPCDAGCGV